MFEKAYAKAKQFVEANEKAVITAGMIVVGAVVGLVIVAAAMNEETKTNDWAKDAMEHGQIQPNDDPNDPNVYAVWPNGEREVIG